MVETGGRLALPALARAAATSKQHFFHVRDIVTPGVDDLPLGQSVEFELGITSATGSRKP